MLQGKALLEYVTLDTSLKSKAARDKNKDKGNPTAWRKTWEDALSRLYPENVVSYPDRVQSNLKQAIAKRGLPLHDMCQFLDWIVINWQQLRKNTFSLNPKTPYGPEVPDLMFVIPRLLQVHATYQRGKAEIAASLPLGQRLAGSVAAPAPTPPPPSANPDPARPLAPLNRLPIKRFKPDPIAADAARQRLGLPKWEG